MTEKLEQGASRIKLVDSFKTLEQQWLHLKIDTVLPGRFIGCDERGVPVIKDEYGEDPVSFEFARIGPIDRSHVSRSTLVALVHTQGSATRDVILYKDFRHVAKEWGVSTFRHVETESTPIEEVVDDVQEIISDTEGVPELVQQERRASEKIIHVVDHHTPQLELPDEAWVKNVEKRRAILAALERGDGLEMIAEMAGLARSALYTTGVRWKIFTNSDPRTSLIQVLKSLERINTESGEIAFESTTAEDKPSPSLEEFASIEKRIKRNAWIRSADNRRRALRVFKQARIEGWKLNTRELAAAVGISHTAIHNTTIKWTGRRFPDGGREMLEQLLTYMESHENEPRKRVTWQRVSDQKMAVLSKKPPQETGPKEMRPTNIVAGAASKEAPGEEIASPLLTRKQVRLVDEANGLIQKAQPDIQRRELTAEQKLERLIALLTGQSELTVSKVTVTKNSYRTPAYFNVPEAEMTQMPLLRTTKIHVEIPTQMDAEEVSRVKAGKPLRPIQQALEQLLIKEMRALEEGRPSAFDPVLQTTERIELIFTENVSNQVRAIPPEQGRLVGRQMGRQRILALEYPKKKDWKRDHP